jgi:hypothetical protein
MLTLTQTPIEVTSTDLESSEIFSVVAVRIGENWAAVDMYEVTIYTLSGFVWHEFVVAWTPSELEQEVTEWTLQGGTVEVFDN